MVEDLLYRLKVPSKDVWFVQNTLENFDGLALLTKAQVGKDFCIMEVITNTDFDELLFKVFSALKEEIGDLCLDGPCS